MAAGRPRRLLDGHLEPLRARFREARLGIVTRHQSVERDAVDTLLALLLHP